MTTLPAGLVRDAFNWITETDDFIKALFMALPKELRIAAYKRAAARGERSFTRYVYLEALARNWRQIKPGEALDNLIKEYLEDQFYGRLLS